MQQLGDDQVGDVVGDGGAEEDDPLVQKTRVDVEGTLSARGLLDDHGNEWAHGRDSLATGQTVPQEPGVQISPDPSSASFSGVQSFSRASAVLERDRLGALDDEVHGLAHGDVLAQRVVGALGRAPA